MLALLTIATLLLQMLFTSGPEKPTEALVPADWKEVGQLKARSAKEIKNSTWSIGGETLDRDYTDYQAYKKYLGPLGATRIRLQGGWAKCEKVKGQYDFAWLDAVVDDALSQGIKPWIQTSYGNSIYEGGGEAALAGGIPTSEVALKAWDAWVAALVKHFNGRVTEWEIWNEPDLSKKFTASQFARFHERTAGIIRQEQPKARIIGLALCCTNWNEYADTVLTHLSKVNKKNLMDVVTFHGYALRPEDTYKRVEELQKVFAKHGMQVEYMQGENGAPSTPKAITIGAMRERDWTELTQVKWDLRRMLGDHGRGISTNLFTISDIHYAAGDHMEGVNSKGLLKTNPDKTIERPKIAYQAAQNIFSLFDNQLERLPETKLKVNQENITTFGYEHTSGKGIVVTLWADEATPAETYTPKTTTLTLTGTFKSPVFIDLISGKVYGIPKNDWKKEGSTYTFTNIPVPDYPVAIAEKSILTLTK
ncbi:GH39 family glycosyl hydrolase [Adhaeribacter pallidiroseus]|uniref:Glycosyl hydrolases family 39 N-terminal catalytic domain-containing protein n=1 Tax=Adhaeribacter pallidiroseus TaxID=2072847 RepID=A0A369Q9N0_9BACT|nr:hypothetical protein [Adhaeribacter pallidiroseus]RDC61593.1 hypothetical protein AHMF7616_00173 [Adhaeribacter pallidiroseus]